MALVWSLFEQVFNIFRLWSSEANDLFHFDQTICKQTWLNIKILFHIFHFKMLICSWPALAVSHVDENLYLLRNPSTFDLYINWIVKVSQNHHNQLSWSFRKIMTLIQCISACLPSTTWPRLETQIFFLAIYPHGGTFSR